MAKHITLTQEERTELSQLIKSGKHSARVLGRARILLLLDRSQGEQRKLEEIADAMLTSIGTVSNVKRRYLEGGLEHGLYDRPRPGAKPEIDGEVEAYLIALVCSDPPEGQDRWTLRLLADKLVELELVESISHVAVRDALKKNEIKPWQVRSWCIPEPSARFVAQMEDILMVYQQPYDPKRPQVCLDEIHKNLRSTPRGEIPMEKGRPKQEE